MATLLKSYYQTMQLSWPSEAYLGFAEWGQSFCKWTCTFWCSRKQKCTRHS